jgi:O-succinylbenzoate synthase
VPSTPGRGYEVKTGLVEKLTVRREEVRALQAVS